MPKLQNRRIAKLMRIVKSFEGARTSQGLYPAIMKLLSFVKQLFFRGDCFLYARSLEEEIPVTADINNLVIREAQVSELPLLSAAKNDPSDAVWYNELQERQRCCVLALKANQLVAFGWYTAEVDPAIDRTYVPLARDEIFIFDLYTVPTFRRQGIQTVLLQQMLERARKRGYKRALSLVRVDNLPSTNLHEKLGFHIISRFTKVRVLGLVRFYYRPNIFGKAGSLVRWL
jgi:ribosomal protein S18 acetylase RimI-like enzyme